MIKANFKTYASYVTDSLYQWDLNQVLSVSGLNLSVAPEVHFSNANMDKAIVRQATLSNHVVSVKIPNSLLQDSLTIYAHIGIYEGNTFKVIEKIEIPVIRKERPKDYRIETSDEEVYSFEALRNALTNKADNARVDHIIAHNNDTEGNTELADIRSGADNIIYDSAGEAVREQIRKTVAHSARTRLMIEGGTMTGDILLDAIWDYGYIGDFGSIVKSSISNGESYTANLLRVTPDTNYSLRYVRNNSGIWGWYSIAEYDVNGTYLRRMAFDENNGEFSDVVTEGGEVVSYFDYTSSSDAKYVRVSLRTWLFGAASTSDEIERALYYVNKLVRLIGDVTYFANVLPDILSNDERAILSVKNGVWTKFHTANINPNIKSVNHRGYNSIAPENTLSAFRLSKKMGFDMVEADVSFTSDGYAVLLHDPTIDRTSNGTGAINNLTFKHVRSLDFGSWKSNEFVGEQIPTFDEFISLCREIGLYPYIEIKSPVTQDQIKTLVDIVRAYGMSKNVTWITASGATYLNYIKTICPDARLGLVVTSITEEIVDEMVGLKTDKNKVFIDAVSTELTDDMIYLCAENDIPVEVWDLWSAEQIRSANKYISGFTTDTVIAGVELYKANL